MKHHLPTPASRRLLALLASVTLATTPSLFATTYTWDGGDGSDANFSNATNWSTDIAPAATGDNLIFDGTNNLAVNNDLITALSTSTAGSLTFAATASSFIIGGNTLTVGSGGGGAIIAIQQNSPNAQTVSANLTFTGGGGDRSIVFASGAGSLTLSGAINASNDWIFPTTTAGTIQLTGSISGDGKAAITAGTNAMRAIMRNNVAGTNLVLGTGTLGNAATGGIATANAVLRGIIANQQLNVRTNGADLDLSGYTFAVNANNITFNDTHALSLGNLVTVGGNRDFHVSGAGGVTVASGIFTSADQTARQLYLNLSGAGGMVMNGQLYDTLHSGGVTTTINDGSATATTGIFRRAGTGTLTLNGDSGTTFNGTVQIETGGTLKIGHANALGSTTGATIILGGATLDLNGQTIGESLKISSGTGVGGNGALINSNTTTGAVITADIVNPGSTITIGGAGDITATRIRSAGVFTITKIGGGTLTTSGNNHNNLSAWNIQAGTVVLANTSGLGADRGVTLNGGTLKLDGLNSDLINNGQAFTINSGIFDLNGKSEAVSSILGAAGTVTNSLAGSTSTLYVGGGNSGTSDGTFSGAIENGAGTLKLTKEGTGTQTLTGINTYSGATTISNGTIALSGTGTLGGGPLTVNGTFDVSAVNDTIYVTPSVLGGSGVVNASGKTLQIDGTLQPVGSLDVTGDVALGSSAASTFVISDVGGANDSLAVTGALALGGSLAVTTTGAFAFADAQSFGFYSAASVTTGLSNVTVGGLALTGNSGVWTVTDSGLTYTFTESTGVLTVSASSTATALETWRQTHFADPANTGPGADAADADGDGLPNLLEYATGTLPTSANGPAAQVGVSGGFLTLSYTRIADPALTYTVQATNDLATAIWTTVATADSPTTGAANLAGPVTVTDTTATNAQPKRFLRLQVSY